MVDRDRRPTASRPTRTLLLIAVVAVAFNLRPGVVSLGPVLEEVRQGLGLSVLAAGALTTLPVLAFAFAGAWTPWLQKCLGVRRLILWALVPIAVGLALRPWIGGWGGFLALSVLALCGMAVLNVALPSTVSLFFADRVGIVTSAYSTSLSIGITAAAALTVPISAATGSWRWGLTVWSASALLAIALWLCFAGRAAEMVSERDPAPPITLRSVARTRLGWAMALFFALQSTQAFVGFGWFAQIYRDAGFSAPKAGLLLGVITATLIPLSAVVPFLAVRMRRPGVLIVTLTALYPIGYLGLLWAPVSGAWAWAVLIGAANTVFPVALTLISVRARTESGTAALSGFTQSMGYLLSVVGLFGITLVHDVTNGWGVPLVVLAALAVPQLAVGLVVARPAFIEDSLRPARVAAVSAGR